MIRFYLITGFLGAGKTTFLKEFIHVLKASKPAVLVNDFGKEDVDGKLLTKFSAILSEIHNGSIFCACRLEQFEQALCEMIAQKPDCILIETSGLSDPTNIKAILSEKRYADISYHGCFCLVDAVRFHKVHATARVIGAQLAVADAVILNKCDLIDDVALQKLTAFIAQNIADGTPIYPTSYGKLQPAWLHALTASSAAQERVSSAPDISLFSTVIRISPHTPQNALNGLLHVLAPECHRVKGFVTLTQAVYYVSAVGGQVHITPADNGYDSSNRLVLLSGRGLHLTNALQSAYKKFGEYFIVD